MKRSFLKRGLLLSAASATLLSVPAYADDLTISSSTTSAVKTSTANNGAGDITINSNGSITITQAGPAVTLDSSNDVSILGNLSNKNTSNAQGIVIDTGTHDTASTFGGPDTITGSLSVTPTNTVTNIDLSGSGTGKVGLAIIGNGQFGGNIVFGNSLIGPVTMLIQGDQSAGIAMSSTAILHGDLDIASSITMTPTTANETSATGISVVNLAGEISGNVLVGAGSSLRSFGQGSLGFISTGKIHGSFVNSGLIDVESFQESTNQSTGAVTVPKGSGDPIGGSAVQIGASILGGFMNSGPDGVNTSPSTGVITSDGGGSTMPAVLYVSSGFNGVPLEIGVYNPTTPDPVAGYSFYNRGIIGSTSGSYSNGQITGPVDPNLSVNGVVFMGSSTAPVTLDGLGLLNSGNITVVGRTTSSGTAPISLVALGIGSVGISDTASSAGGGYVTVGTNNASGATPGIYNSGSITASAQGDLGATAIAIDIGSHSVVKNIINSGSIVAAVKTNNPSKVTTETMYAINDQSGTLSSIVNSGTISAATPTPLTTLGGITTTYAAYLANNTSGVTFTNTGTVTGDIVFGQGADTLSVTGSGSAISTVLGNINFGANFSNSNGTTDKLNIGAFGVVAGQIIEADKGMLDVHISSGGKLSVLNNSVRQSLLLNDLTMDANSRLVVAVSTLMPNNVSIDAEDISITNANSCAVGNPNACTVSVAFSSFVPASGRFVLMQAPTGHLLFNGGNTQQDAAQVVQGLNNQIPFLFTGSAAFLTNQSGLDQVVLNLTPKNASTLGLSGYAAQVFPYANIALENDDTLGAAMIAGVTDNTSAQTAYSQFAPDASGGTRAIAISLTDHATGPVAARQRALRLYATQPGDLTLWGQEFAQQISDKGSDGLPGFKDSGFGFSMGADGGDALGGWYGGAFTFYTGNVDQRPPQSSRDNTQWYMLSGYSTWRGKGLFLDTQLTAGYGDLSAHRFITLVNPQNNTVLIRQANSKRSAALAAAGMTTGANLVYGSTTITPNIAIDGLTMREEGYTETGGGGTTGDGFDLHVNPVLMSSLRAFVGVNARQDVNFGSFFMQPELRVGYRYDLLANRIDLTASFPSVTGTGPGTGDFTITGPQPTKGNLLAGASIAATTGAWSIGLNYDMLSGSNGSMTQVGTVSLVGRI